MKFFQLLFLFLFLGCSKQHETPYVLLISFDGFRADYLDLYHTPNFDRFLKTGVRSKGLIPVFVSKTFPNHYSIATGMYAENHGLIGNHFYDEKLNDSYTLSDRSKVEDPKFYGGEPIWVTAEKQGVKSASYFWVGSEAQIGGHYPSIWKKYEHNFPFESRIDSVVNWFSRPEKLRPQLCMLYFHEPDGTGHDKGPQSDETGQMVMYLDSLFGDLIYKLDQLPIKNQLNIIAVADHGMVEISSERTVSLSSITNMDGITQEGDGPYALLYSDDKEAINQAVKNINDAPNVTAYLRENIPDRFHYKNHHRIKDALVLADEGWYMNNQAIGSSADVGQYIPVGGTHGYDNQLESMHALFTASGPAFKKGFVSEPFENVNIYPLIAHILNLNPALEIDGNIQNVSHLLKP